MTTEKILKENERRAKVMLGARYDEKGNSINIEFYSKSQRCWLLIETPMWDWSSFDYRLIEEPEYVPFETWEEVFENAYNPWGIWLIRDDKAPFIIDNYGWLSNSPDYIEAFKNMRFYDPTTGNTKPFGKLKEASNA